MPESEMLASHLFVMQIHVSIFIVILIYFNVEMNGASWTNIKICNGEKCQGYSRNRNHNIMRNA